MLTEEEPECLTLELSRSRTTHWSVDQSRLLTTASLDIQGWSNDPSKTQRHDVRTETIQPDVLPEMPKNKWRSMRIMNSRGNMTHPAV